MILDNVCLFFKKRKDLFFSPPSEVYWQIFIGNDVLKFSIYIVYVHTNIHTKLERILKFWFRIKTSLLYFTFQNIKVFQSYLMFSTRKCKKKIRLSISLSEIWEKRWLKRLPLSRLARLFESKFFLSVYLFLKFIFFGFSRIMIFQIIKNNGNKRE